MFSPRPFRKRKNKLSSNPSKLHLSQTFSKEILHITSDAYGFGHSTANSRNMIGGPSDRGTPRSMDFVPFKSSSALDDGSEPDPKPNGCASGIWQFIQFDAKPLSPPRLKRRPLRVSSKKFSAPPLKRVPQLVLPKSNGKNRHHFRVGDSEDETRTPFSVVDAKTKRQSTKQGMNFESKRHNKKSVKTMIMNILTPKTSNRSKPQRYATSLDISATESLSSDDDEDSVWNEMSPKYAFQRDLSVKYSQRSQISNGSTEQSDLAADIAKRALRPNFTHVNASYWSEKNQRPYMEDRIILDRVGSMVASNSNAKHVCGLEMSALLKKLENVNTLVSSPVHSDLIPFTQQPISVYGVFDGHAGAHASQYCSDWFSPYLRNQKSFNSDISQALKSTFANIDNDFIRSGREDGTTACTCVLVGGQRIVCANAGDSRAIIVKNDGTFVSLSKDHKPGSSRETKRITELGGKIVMAAGSWRVEGRLACSRAIGDASLKPYVTSDPDVFDYVLQPTDWFLVMASDGIWDVLENDQVATMTLSYSCKVKGTELQVDIENLKLAAKRICERATSLGSNDNLSAIVVDLQN